MADVITQWLIRRIREQSGGEESRRRLLFGYVGAGIGLSIDILLCGAKIVVGTLIGSISVVADAVHTGSDIFSGMIVLWGFRSAHKPPDQEHPFGHGRMEQITALFVALLLCGVGIELMSAAWVRLRTVPVVNANLFVVGLMLFDTLAKEWSAAMTLAFAREIDSSALKAGGWHHHSDAISSMLVVLAMLGAMAKIYVLDSIFGIIVAGYIVYTGWTIIAEAVRNLLGKRADPATIAQIQEFAQQVSGVAGVHDIVVHDYGQHKAISLHVEVSPRLDVAGAHAIAEQVERRIAAAMSSSPIVHIDLHHGKRLSDAAAMGAIGQICRRFPQIHGFHGMRLGSSEYGNTLRLHVVMPKALTVEIAHRLEHRLAKSLQRVFPAHKVELHIEPCAQNCSRCRSSAPPLPASSEVADDAAF
jgi:cation diffusion facilitator family transporter